MENTPDLHVSVEIASCTLVKSPGWSGQNIDQSVDRVWFLESGSAWLRTGKQRQSLKPGHLYVLPTQSLFDHGTTASGATFHWCHLRSSLWGVPGGLAHYSIPHEQALTKAQQANIKCLIADLAQCLVSDSAHDSIRRNRLTWELLECILPEDLTLAPANHQQLQRIQPALSAMRIALDKPLAMADLADLVRWDPAHFSTVFKEIIGVPPLTYHHQLRCNAAKEQLLNSDDTLDMIAHRFGYTDGFHFSKTFKRITGQTPKLFRQRRGTVAP